MIYLLKCLAKLKNKACSVKTRGGAFTQDPLYPEGHPKRLEKDSQNLDENVVSSPKKKRKEKHKRIREANDNNSNFDEDPNSISISDAETESGNEHDNDKNDASNKEESEVELENPPKNKKYDKEEFIPMKHGKEREPWVQKSMPFPSKTLKGKEEEHYNKFCEWMKPLFLQIPLMMLLSCLLFPSI